MVTLNDEQKFTFSLQEVDAKGQPVPGVPTFDAAPVWVSDNEAVAKVTINADGISGDVVAGIPGTATISVSAAIGGKDVAGVDQVTVTASAPVSLNLTASALADQDGGAVATPRAGGPAR